MRNGLALIVTAALLAGCAASEPGPQRPAPSRRRLWLEQHERPEVERPERALAEGWLDPWRVRALATLGDRPSQAAIGWSGASRSLPCCRVAVLPCSLFHCSLPSRE